MSILAFYSYEGVGQITPLNTDQALGITVISNPSAMCTIDRIMVVNLKDKTFTLDEVKEITKFVKSLKK